MKEIATFNVTLEHIEKGTPDDGQGCPLNLALQDVDYHPFDVGLEDTICNEHDANGLPFTLILRHTDRLQRWIDAFDEGKSPSPITITMNTDGNGNWELDLLDLLD